MKNMLKLTLFNSIFSLIYFALHFIFSLVADMMLSDMPYLFMRICYVVFSFAVFFFLGKLLKCEGKKNYLKYYLVFCAISIIFCILTAILDTYILVVFNTAPLLFDLEILDLFFPWLEKFEITTLIIMLIENAIKISALYLDAKLSLSKEIR